MIPHRRRKGELHILTLLHSNPMPMRTPLLILMGYLIVCRQKTQVIYMAIQYFQVGFLVYQFTSSFLSLHFDILFLQDKMMVPHRRRKGEIDTLLHSNPTPMRTPLLILMGYLIVCRQKTQVIYMAIQYFQVGFLVYQFTSSFLSRDR